MERRNFLQSAVVAGTAAALSREAMAQPAEPKKGIITSSVMLWTLKGSFEERVEAAAKSGMQSVELVGEHTAWTPEKAAEMKKLVRSYRMGMDTILAQPDWGKRPVSMVNPAHREGFLQDVKDSIVWSQKLEIPQIILMSGNEVPGMSHEDQYASLLEGAKRAGELAMKANVNLIVEPLNNKINHKGFFLTNNVEGMKLMKDTDNPHVKLLFDIYHEQVQMGNVVNTLRAALPYVAVFHIADNPGRNDPGTGEMNYSNIYKAIAKTGYSGYVTMEYLPVGEQVASLTKAVNDMRASFSA